MKYDTEKHHRRSIRLKNYDYSQAGIYYITIVTQNRECLFGDVVNGEMIINTFGRIIEYHWQKLPSHFKNIKLDYFQIMPNHFHGIIVIMDDAGAIHSVENKLQNENDSVGDESLPHGTQPGSLAAIMQNIQSVTARKINKIKKIQGQKLWQRNYWEHIIRNEQDLNRIRKYIMENPLKWELDDENPNKLSR